jgi:hypothetical protein
MTAYYLSFRPQAVTLVRGIRHIPRWASDISVWLIDLVGMTDVYVFHLQPHFTHTHLCFKPFNPDGLGSLGLGTKQQASWRS